MLVAAEPRGTVSAGGSALARYLAACAGVQRASIERAERLSGGAIQQNWLLDVLFDDQRLDMIASSRAALDALQAAPRPVLEWGLRWLERHAPPPGELVLCHRDFRTGNYMVDENGVTAILDWEFAGWGDRGEDLGWFCAMCWRFGATAMEAGGIGSREAFYRGYERVSNVRIDPREVHYWEVAAHVRWGIIAMLQANRHLCGAEPSLELALTSHIVPELEFEILELTGGAR